MFDTFTCKLGLGRKASLLCIKVSEEGKKKFYRTCTKSCSARTTEWAERGEVEDSEATSVHGSGDTAVAAAVVVVVVAAAATSAGVLSFPEPAAVAAAAVPA